MSDIRIGIVGGGVIGLSLAWHLSRTSTAEVTLLDRGRLGGSSSWAAAGILPPPPIRGSDEPIDRLRQYSHQRWPAWAKDLELSSGLDVQLRRCGGVYVARSPGEFASLLAQQLWWEETGIEYERWPLTRFADHSEVAAQVASRLEAAGLDRPVWLLPDEYQIRPPRLSQALAAAISRNGVKIADDAEIQAIEQEADGVMVRTVSEVQHFDRVCVCSGAWTALTLRAMDIDNGILPVRGQMLLYRLPEVPFEFVLNEGHRYLVPRNDGLVLAGSCEEEVGYAEGTTPERIDEIAGWVESLVGDWRSHLVRTWSGLRPGSFDSLPYLGPVPGRSNLFVASGHYRSGIHLSIATAHAMADLMLDRTPPLDLSAFHLTRGRTNR